MKRLLLAVLLTGCAGTMPQGTSLDLGQVVPPAQDVQDAMLNAVNAARAVARDCQGPGGPVHFNAAQALQLNSKLTLTAQYHTQDMATHSFFDHQGSKGDSTQNRIDAVGYAFQSIGENLGKVSSSNALALQTNVQTVVSAWLVSTTGHCQTLMNPVFRELGVGFVEKASSGDRYFWTQDFGNPK